MTSSNVPRERGKSSYQLANSACGRSTSTAIGSGRLASARSSTSAIWRRVSAPVSRVTFWSTSPSDNAFRTGLSLRRLKCLRASAISVATSMPARCLTSSAWQRVAYSSRHASIVNRCRPMRLGNRAPRQRSLPIGTSGARCHSFSSAARHSSSAASSSWPSANMSASTVIGRPMMRLAANAPPLTCGVTRSMTTGGRKAAALAVRRSGRLPSRTAPMRLRRATRISPGASRSGSGSSATVRGLPSNAPAAGSRGSRLTGIGCDEDGSLLIRATMPFCAARPSAASRRARTVTWAKAPVSRRISPIASTDARRSASWVVSLTAASRSFSKPAGIMNPPAVVAASLSARRRRPMSGGAIRSGASARPITGAARRSESYSATYQSARPSHHAVDAKTPSRPAPIRSA